MTKIPIQQRQLHELILNYGEHIVELYSKSRHPITSHIFAEVIACLELLEVYVIGGAYEGEVVEEPGVYPFPRLGVGSLRASYFWKTLRSLRDQPGSSKHYIRITNEYFGENEQVVKKLQLILDSFYSEHACPKHVKLVIWHESFANGLLAPAGGVHYQSLEKDWQITWIEAFNRELKYFRLFLEKELLRTCTAEYIDAELAKVLKRRAKMQQQEPDKQDSSDGKNS